MLFKKCKTDMLFGHQWIKMFHDFQELGFCVAEKKASSIRISIRTEKN